MLRQGASGNGAGTWRSCDNKPPNRAFDLTQSARAACNGRWKFRDDGFQAACQTSTASSISSFTGNDGFPVAGGAGNRSSDLRDCMNGCGELASGMGVTLASAPPSRSVFDFVRKVKKGLEG